MNTPQLATWNKIPEIILFTISMHPEDFLTIEEWHKLLAAAPTQRDAALLWLMAGCGLRVSEVAALKVEHIFLGACACLALTREELAQSGTVVIPLFGDHRFSIGYDGQMGCLSCHRRGCVISTIDPWGTGRRQRSVGMESSRRPESW